MSLSDKHLCSDEDCAVFITESDDPFVCLHWETYAEGIDYWGRVARGEMETEEVIDSYREKYDFSTATSLADHFDTENAEWTGPTADIEVRVNNEPVETFTAYPHDRGQFPGFETVRRYAEGYMEGWYAGAVNSSPPNTDDNPTNWKQNLLDQLPKVAVPGSTIKTRPGTRVDE